MITLHNQDTIAAQATASGEGGIAIVRISGGECERILSRVFRAKNGRQLATAVKGSYTLSFEYNDEGIRTSKTVNGVEHIYRVVGSQIVTEEWGNNLIIYLYDAEGAPIGMQYRNTSYAEGAYDTYWFEKNLQGDIVAVYSETGTKLMAYTYDAGGNFSTTYYNGGASTTATYNPFRYRGYYYDAELGFYYLNSRYYDPAIGRFINPDDVSLLGANGDFASLNLYAYCGNNPVARADDGGEFWGTITGAIFGAIGGAIGAALENKNIFAGAAIGAATGALSGLAVDLSIATGGLAGIAIAAAGGALSSIVEDVSNNIVNNDDFDLGEIAFNAGFSAFANVVSFGMGLDGVKTGAKSIGQAFKNTAQNFTSSTIANSRNMIPKQLSSKLKNLGKNIVSNFSETILFDGTMEYFKWRIECFASNFN